MQKYCFFNSENSLHHLYQMPILAIYIIHAVPDSKVHGANMGPIWADRAQVGPMLAPWTLLSGVLFTIGHKTTYSSSLDRSYMKLLRAIWGIGRTRGNLLPWKLHIQALAESSYFVTVFFYWRFDVHIWITMCYRFIITSQICMFINMYQNIIWAFKLYAEKSLVNSWHMSCRTKKNISGKF